MSAANHLFTWKKPYELKKTDWISFRKPLLDIIMVNNGVFSENEPAKHAQNQDSANDDQKGCQKRTGVQSQAREEFCHKHTSIA